MTVNRADYHSPRREQAAAARIWMAWNAVPFGGYGRAFTVDGSHTK